MTYKERFDKRKFDELRPIEAKVGVIKNADGSAYFKIGKTWAYAAVYGPRNLFPRFLKDPKKGVLRCNYNMMPFSGSGDRIRPGQNRRAKEISMVIEKALMPVVNLDKFPNAVVDIYIELPQTDAGTRCAGITAAAMALADAGVEMKDLVASVSVGRVDDKIVADLEYAEEAYEGGPVADIPTAYIPSMDAFSLLQTDGEVTKEQYKQAMELAKKASLKVYEIQKNALKEKFNNVGNGGKSK